MKFLWGALLLALGCNIAPDSDPDDHKPHVIQVDGTYTATMDEVLTYANGTQEVYHVENVLVIVDQIGPAVVWWGLVGLADAEEVRFDSQFQETNYVDWSLYVVYTISGVANHDSATLRVDYKVINGNGNMINHIVREFRFTNLNPTGPLHD